MIVGGSLAGGISHPGAQAEEWKLAHCVVIWRNDVTRCDGNYTSFKRESNNEGCEIVQHTYIYILIS